MVVYGVLINYAIIIIPTAAVTFLLTVVYERARNYLKNKREKRKRSDMENKNNLTKLNNLMKPVMILQPCKLSEKGSFSIRLDETQTASERVSEIIAKYSEKWSEELGYYNNYIFGATHIDSYRLGEKEEIFISIRGRRAGYFEFLATNANVTLRKDLDKNDDAWIRSKILNYDPFYPISEFANPLSVEVLLLCENETKAVMSTRSEKTVFRGGKVGPSVMETVSPALEEKTILKTEINIFGVIRRGLKEELGIDSDEIEQVYLTSLAFDSEVLDYKFTAVAVTHLTQKEIENRFNLGFPKDRWENKKINFIDYPPKILDVEKIKNDWLPEAIAAMIMAMAESEGWKKLEKVISVK